MRVGRPGPRIAQSFCMFARGPTWHALVSVVAPLSLLSVVPVAGCYDAHGNYVDTGRDARPFRDVAPPIDVAIVDAAASPDGGDRCQSYFEQLRSGVAPESIGCDGRTFPRGCVTPVGECCQLFLDCAIEPGDGGHVVANLSCDDSCDQGCPAQTLEDCALFPYCEHFDPGACGPASAGIIEGPACIYRRGAPCSSDADCAVTSGERCRTYWINPCAGLPCDACGGEERRCSP